MSTITSSLRAIASGAMAMSAAGVLRLMLQFISVPILARLLSPEEYGLAAIAMPFIILVMMVAEAGLSSSLVRLTSINTPAWHTCFWLMAGLGVVGCATIAMLAPTIGVIFEEPRLVPIVTVLALTVLAQAVLLVPGAALQHQRRFGLIATIEVAAVVTSIGAAIVAASAGLGVWSLVWQQLVFYAVRLAFTCLFTPDRPRFEFNLPEAREHVMFGRNLLGATLVSLASRSVDSLMVGKVAGPAQVGVYSMAFQFARLPFMLVTGPLQYAMYPYIAAMRADKVQVAACFLLFTRLLAAVVFPSVALVAAASSPIFHLLLSAKWSAAGGIFCLIAPAAALQPVTAVTGTFLMALGRTDLAMKLALQFAGVWVVGIIVTVSHGVEAVATCYSVCVLSFALWSLHNVLPLVGCSFGRYYRALAWPATATAVAALVYRSGGSHVVDSDIGKMAVALALALLAIGLSLAGQRSELMAVFHSSGTPPAGAMPMSSPCEDTGTVP